MSFWSGETLAQKLPSLIEPFDSRAIDCAAYTLSIGNEIYVSPDGTIINPDRHTKQILGKGESFTIPPGQFAFLLTKEKISVPDDAIAFISIKGRMKFKGLINISGFHADPGYEGQLLFSVLNASPKPLHFQQGQKLFLIWYANLDRPTAQKRSKRGFEYIDPGLINGISGEILSLQSLSHKQRKLEASIERQKTLVTVFVSLAVALLVMMIGTIATQTTPGSKDLSRSLDITSQEIHDQDE